MARASQKKSKKVNRVRSYSYYDYSLLLLTIFLVCFGLIMIYSTSSYSAQLKQEDSMSHYTLKDKRQKTKDKRQKTPLKVKNAKTRPLPVLECPLVLR